MSNSLYDIEAITPEGKECIVEVRTRSPEAKTQFFTIRDTKIKNLRKIADHLKVELIYIICINKYGHSMFTLEQLITEKIPNIRMFKYKSSKAISAKTGLPGLKSPIDKKLFIRCSDGEFDTRKRFRKLMVEHDFKDYEETLQTLIMMGENHPQLVKKSKLRYA